MRQSLPERELAASLGRGIAAVARATGLGAPFLTAVADAAETLEGAGIDYVLVGGLASAAHGRPRSTDDVDLLVSEQQALAALAALGRAGFATEETNPSWIYKATRGGVTIDVIFAMKGAIHLDAEMLARAPTAEVDGRPVRVAPPEDLVVSKAIAHDEPSGHHWHDALALLARAPLDWPYLLRRAQLGARRVLALLVYAQADDLVVPSSAIADLYASVYGRNGRG